MLLFSSPRISAIEFPNLHKHYDKSISHPQGITETIPRMKNFLYTSHNFTIRYKIYLCILCLKKAKGKYYCLL